MSAGTNGSTHHICFVKLLDNIDATADRTSVVQNINNFALFAVQYYWDTFAGNALVITEASNDGTNWTTVDSFIPSGATGSRMLNVEKAGYGYVRVRYTQTGASGNFSTSLNGKVT